MNAVSKIGNHDYPVKRTRSVNLLLHTMAGLVLMTMSSCVLGNPEYERAASSARTNWKGNEIVGVWVAKTPVPFGEMRSTALFRPNGTGLLRQKSANKVFEFESSWHYSGQGLWEGQATSKNRGDSPFTMILRLTDNELLVEEKFSFPPITGREIYVREDKQDRVNDYLKNR